MVVKEGSVKILYNLIRFITPILFLLTLMIPKSKKKICFGAWFGEKYEGSPRSIFEYGANNSDYIVLWISKNIEVIELVRSLGYRAHHAYSIVGIFHQLTASLFVCNVSSRDFAPFCMGWNSSLVNLGHGMPMKASFADRHTPAQKLKKWLRDATIDQYAFVVVSGPKFLDIAMKQYKKSADEVLILPEARCDNLLRPNVSSVDLKVQYEVPPNHLVGLYMPTHRNEGLNINAISVALDNLDRVASELGGITFIVNFHFYDRKFVHGLQQHKNLRLISQDVDIGSFMWMSDFFIGDYSGVVFDYLYLQKPCVGFLPDLTQYLRNHRGLYFDPTEIYSVTCKDIPSLLGALTSLMAGELAFERRDGFHLPNMAIGEFAKANFERLVEVI